MKKQAFLSTSPMPERPELRGLPRAPRVLMDVARVLRYRARGEEGMSGVMSQHAARVLMAHLAVLGSASQLTLAEKNALFHPHRQHPFAKNGGRGLRVSHPRPKRPPRDAGEPLREGRSL